MMGYSGRPSSAGASSGVTAFTTAARCLVESPGTFAMAALTQSVGRGARLLSGGGVLIWINVSSDAPDLIHRLLLNLKSRRSYPMHRFLFGSLFALTLLSVGIDSATAARYCLQGRSWGHPGNCQFQTLRACQASARGTSASCGLNPAYAHARAH